MSNQYQNIVGITISNDLPYSNNNYKIDSSGRVDEKINTNILLNTYNYIVEEILEQDPNPPDENFIFVESDDNYVLKHKSSSTYINYDVPLSSTVFVKDINCVYILKNKTTSPFTQEWVKYENFDPTKLIMLTHTDTSLITYGDIIVNSNTQTEQLKVNENAILNNDIIIHNNETEESLSEESSESASSFSFIDSTNQYYNIDDDGTNLNVYNIIEDNNQNDVIYKINFIENITIFQQSHHIISFCLNEEDLLFILSSIEISLEYTYYLTIFNLHTKQVDKTIILNDPETLIISDQSPIKIVNCNHNIYLLTTKYITELNNTTYNLYVYQYDYYSENELLKKVSFHSADHYILPSALNYVYIYNDNYTNKQILYIVVEPYSPLIQDDPTAQIISIFDETYNIELESEVVIKNISCITSDYIGNIYILPYGSRHQIIKYTPEHKFIYYNGPSQNLTAKLSYVDKNNDIYIVYDNIYTYIGLLKYDINAHDYIYSQLVLSDNNYKFTYINKYNEFLTLGHVDETDNMNHTIIVYKLSEGNLINYKSSTLNNNLTITNSKLTIGENKIILNGYNGDIYSSNINSYSGSINDLNISGSINLNDNILIRKDGYYEGIETVSDSFHTTSNLIKLKANGTIVAENVDINQSIEYNSFKCDDMIVDGSRVEMSNYFFNYTPDKLLFYGETDNGLYIITKDTTDNPVDPETLITDYHLYYISYETVNNTILPKTEISLNDLPLTPNKYKIITAYVYNNTLLVLFNDLNQADVTKKYICPVYSTIYKIHTYTHLNFEWQGYPDLTKYTTPLFKKFIHSYVLNTNDVYVFDTDRVYLVFFENKEPTTLYELLWYNSGHTELITENMHVVHNISNYMYLMCDGCYYRYDMTNITMTRITYKCIEYPGPQQPPDIIPSMPGSVYPYQFSVSDFIIAYGQIYSVFFKFANMNKIYYLDERDLSNPVIRPLLHPPSFVNDNICTFTVKNGYIYNISEYYKSTEPTFYNHSMIMYNTQNRKIINEKEINENIGDDYSLNINYYSVVPLIYTNNGAILIELGNSLVSPDDHYKCCKVWYPICEISGLNTYIKNFRIITNNDSIVLAAGSVVMPNNTITTKLVTQQEIIKTDNDINLTQYSKSNIDTMRHHYQTTKGIFYLISESNPGSIRCFLFTSHKTITKSNFLNTSGSIKEYIQSAFVYNDMLYALVASYSTETYSGKNYYIPTTNLYMLVFDIVNNNNNIDIIQTIQIINDENNPYNGYNFENRPTLNNGGVISGNPYFLSSYYTYDPNIIIQETIINDNNQSETINNLYIFNSYTNKLYKSNLVNTVLYFEFIKEINFEEINYKLQQYSGSVWNDIYDKQYCYIINDNQLCRYENNQWFYVDSVQVDSIGAVANPNIGDYQFIDSSGYKLQQYQNNGQSNVWVNITDKQFCYILNENRLFTYYNSWSENTYLVYVNDIGPVSPSANAYQFIKPTTIYALQQYSGSVWNNITNKQYCYVNDTIQLFIYDNTWTLSDSVVYVNNIEEDLTPNNNDYQFFNDNGVYKLQQYQNNNWVDITDKECCYIINENRLFTYNGSWSEDLTVISVNRIGEKENPSANDYQFIKEVNATSKLQKYDIYFGQRAYPFSNRTINITTPQLNVNYSNVETILLDEEKLYFIYNKRIHNESNDYLLPLTSDYDPNSDFSGNNRNVHFKRKYNVYVHSLSKLLNANNPNNPNRNYHGYNMYIQYYNVIPKTTAEEHYGNSDILLYNFATFYNNSLYFNFLNQNRDTRGIYYINILTEATCENPRVFNKNNQLYPTNAYSYNITKNKFFVITTQDFIASTGPQLFSYYFNYNDIEENIIQSVKFAEKTNYSKFSTYIEPIILESSEVLMIDNNKVYDIYQAALFSHMFSNDRSVINNNVIITPKETIFYNNLTINDTSCRLSIEPKNNNDVTNKFYVDELFNGISTNELVLKHEGISISAVGDILTNGNIYTNDILIGDIFKYTNALPFSYVSYHATNYATYFVGEVITENGKRVQKIYMLFNKSLEIQVIDTITVNGNAINSAVIAAFAYNLDLYLLFSKSINVYRYGVKKYTYNNISGYNNCFANCKDMLKSIRIINNNIVYLYIIDKYGIYKLEFNTNDSPKSVSKVKSATISTPIYDAHHVISNNVDYIYIITETKYYKYDINSNNLNDPVYTYEDISTQSTHTYKYSLVDNNTIYFKYEGINKIYYLDDGQNPNIKIFTNATVEDPSTPRFNFEVCNFNIIDNIIYFILEKYENSIYSYVFLNYTISTNKETYGYNLDDNSFKLANPYNSSIPLVKSNSSIILIDDNSTIANRYPVSFIKIQPIVFTKNAIHLFHNMFISENICRVRSVPETDFDIVNKKYVDDLISDIGQNIHSINLLVNNSNENRNLNQPLLLTTNENYNGTFSITWIVNNTETIEIYDFCQLINYTKSNVNISIFNAANIKTPNNSLNKVLFIKEFNINNNVYKCVIDDDTSGLINGLKYVNNKVKIPYLINIVNNNDNVELHYDYNEQYESRIINSNEKWLLQFNNIILKKK